MCPDMPPKMFVTCLYGVLDVDTGRIRIANAGHNLPYVRTAIGTVELRATGMPLGLIPGIDYEETEAVLEPGQTMLLHSDGVAEAHDAEREMFGFPRLLDVVGARARAAATSSRACSPSSSASPPEGWEQEDDITLVAIRARLAAAGKLERPRRRSRPSRSRARPATSDWRPSGSPRRVAPLELEPARLEKLKTAVAEAAMNAIEHGARVERRSCSSRSASAPPTARSRCGSPTTAAPQPLGEAEEPDLEAKLEGLQKPRGWGLFLIRSMVDDVRVETDGDDAHDRADHATRGGRR